MTTALVKREDMSSHDLVMEVRIAFDDLARLNPTTSKFQLIQEIEKLEVPLSLRLANAAMLVKMIEEAK